MPRFHLGRSRTPGRLCAGIDGTLDAFAINNQGPLGRLAVSVGPRNHLSSFLRERIDANLRMRGNRNRKDARIDNSKILYTRDLTLRVNDLTHCAAPARMIKTQAKVSDAVIKSFVRRVCQQSDMSFLGGHRLRQKIEQTLCLASRG